MTRRRAVAGKGRRWAHRRVGAIVALALAMIVPGLALAAGVSVSPPVFGETVNAIPIRGTVSVTLPGSSTVRLTDPRQVPVGTTISATGAGSTVQITAADGKGNTYSGSFGDGSFQVLQSPTGGGATEILLVGKCVKDGTTTSPPVGTVAGRPRHRAPVFRQLQVTAAGEFDVVGASASAVATGTASYSLVDRCNGTQILSKTGRVKATTRSTGAFALDRGESLIDDCQPNAAQPTYCLLVLARPRSSAFSFGLLIAHPSARHFDVCYTAPGGHSICHPGPLGGIADSPGPLKGGLLACSVNDGPGKYPVRFLVNGRIVGTPLQFEATQGRDPSLGRDSCIGALVSPTP